METRTLGASGCKVSTLCLGTMTFGEPDESSFMHKLGCPEPVAHEIMSRSLDAGINFIDTADVYGNDGLSERIVGNWIEKTGHRDRIVLATKFRFTMSRGPNGSGASRYRIVRTVEDSLRRLKTDRIDLYQIHMQDIDTPEEETLRALDDLVRAGKVLYIGASNYTAYRLVDSLWTSRAQGLERYVTLQAQYSLLVRDLEREHVPLCRQWNLGILPWSPLGGGFLSGKYRKGEPPPAGTRLDRRAERYEGYDNDRNWRILDTVESIAKKHGASTSAVSLAWLIAQPMVTSAIFGARSVDQLKDNLATAELKLSPEELEALTTASSFDIGYPYDFISRVSKRW